MDVLPLKLDQYDDKFGFAKELAKTAEKEIFTGGKVLDVNTLPDSDFALVLKGDDGVKRAYPISDPGNTYLSLMYLKKNEPILTKLADGEAVKTAKYYIGRALRNFGLINDFNPEYVPDDNIIDVSGETLNIVDEGPSPIIQLADRLEKIANDTAIVPSKRLQAAKIVFEKLSKDPQLYDAVKTLLGGLVDKIMNVATGNIQPKAVKSFVSQLEDEEEPIPLMIRKIIETPDDTLSSDPGGVLDMVHQLMNMVPDKVGLMGIPNIDPLDFVKPQRMVIIIRKHSFHPADLLTKVISAKDKLAEVLPEEITNKVISNPEFINDLPEELADFILNVIQAE